MHSTPPSRLLLLASLSLGLLLAQGVAAKTCVECHQEITPGIVTDWGLSKHSANDVDCASCHGDGHQSENDVDQVGIPTPETCAGCHEDQVNQFKAGKHAAAWAAMKAMPTTHWLPMALTEGISMGSDHDVFFEGTWAIPGLYLHDWPDRYIHTNFDTAANIDPTKLKRSAFIGAVAAWFRHPSRAAS